MTFTDVDENRIYPTICSSSITNELSVVHGQPWHGERYIYIFLDFYIGSRIFDLIKNKAIFPTCLIQEWFKERFKAQNDASIKFSELNCLAILKTAVPNREFWLYL